MSLSERARRHVGRVAPSEGSGRRPNCGGRGARAPTLVIRSKPRMISQGKRCTGACRAEAFKRRLERRNQPHRSGDDLAPHCRRQRMAVAGRPRVLVLARADTVSNHRPLRGRTHLDRRQFLPDAEPRNSTNERLSSPGARRKPMSAPPDGYAGHPGLLPLPLSARHRLLALERRSFGRSGDNEHRPGGASLLVRLPPGFRLAAPRRTRKTSRRDT